MEFVKSYYHILATALFVFFILVAHLFAISQYNWMENTISDLGAQGYQRKAIMQIGFLIFGITICVGVSLQGLSLRTIPIIIYGLSVALTGIFCAEPFTSNDKYSVMQSTLHSVFAQTAGVAFSIGILIQAFFTSNTQEKVTHVVFFVLVIGLSACFGLVSSYQGVLQRLLYLISFWWLIKFYKP